MTARPSGVPASARYAADAEPNFRWVEGGLDSGGAKHGPYKSWADAGYLHSECTYEHGKIVGPNRVFHPDGMLASVGDWKDGVCMDATYFRPKGESPEAFPGGVGPNVVAVRFCTRDGQSNFMTRHFDAEEREVCDNGDPMPPRPEGVHADASFYPSRQQWIRGSIKRGGSNATVGTWERWQPDGTRIERTEFDADGKRQEFHAWYPDGKVKEVKLEPGGVLRKRQTFHENGAAWRVAENDERGRKTFVSRHRDDGELLDEVRVVWDGDRVVSYEEIEDGKRECSAAREGAGLVCTLFDANVAVARGPIADGRITGVWSTLNPDGTVRHTYDLSPFALETAFETEAKIRGLYWSMCEGIARAAAPAEYPAAIATAASAIAWKEVQTCYGKAKDFPFYLRALVAPDPLAREYGSGSIASQIVHQGSVYEATAKVTPLLLALLADPAASRPSLLSLLHSAAAAAAAYVGEAEASLAEEAKAGAKSEDEASSEDGEDGEDGEDWRKAILGTVDAVGEGVPALLAMLETATPNESRLVVGLLGSARGGPAVRERLVTLARTAKDPALRAVTLHALAKARTVKLEELAPSLDDDDVLPRSVASFSLARHFGPESPPATVTRLREAFDARAELDPRFRRLPFADESVLSHVAMSLGVIRSPEAFALVPHLLAELEGLDGVSATSFGNGLLGLAFGRCEKPFMPGFLDVLDHLAKSERFYAFNVNAAEELRRFGIETGADPEALTKLVTELRAAPDPEDALYRHMHGEEDDEDGEDEEDDDG